MNKAVKKSISLILNLMIILLLLSNTSIVFADEDLSSLHPVHYFMYGEDWQGPLVDKSAEIKSDNYWVDLKYSKVENIPVAAGEPITYFKTLVPKYVLEPKDTAVNQHAKVSTIINFCCAPEFLNTGIIPKWSGLNIFLHPLKPQDNPYFQQFSTIPEDRTNPHKFKRSDILTAEETSKPLEKLQVLADIKAKGSTDSKKVDEYKKGDPIDLEFSMNASWFKRYMNGFALFLTQTGGMSDEGIQKIYNQYAMSDAQIVFSLDIPDGVTVSNNPTATIRGLDGFTANVSKEGNTLLVKLRKNEKAKVCKWKDLIEKINSIDTSNINVSISGLKVSKDASQDSQVTIRGTVSGVYDFATSYTEKFYLPSPEHNSHEELGPGHENCATRNYWSFAAIQDPSGLDNAADSNKPNQISYTFKVNKPADNTVTFKDGNATHATVKVENGKSIDNDALANQSMPSDPTKSGYIFKEWNTRNDGKGTKFTGSTIVNEDMVVYAIYSKNPTPNKPGKLPNNSKLPKTGDNMNMPLYVVVLVISGVLLFALYFKRRKDN